MAKISGSDIRPGMVIEHDESRAAPPSAKARGTGAANFRCSRWPLGLWARQREAAAVKTVAVKPGKDPAHNQVELNNILEGRKFNQRFGGSGPVEETELERRQSQFLYRQGDRLVVMDTAICDEIELSEDFVGERTNFLQDGMREKIVGSTDEVACVRRAE